MARLLPRRWRTDLWQTGLERRNLLRRRTRTGSPSCQDGYTVAWRESVSAEHAAVAGNCTGVHGGDDATWTLVNCCDFGESRFGRVVLCRSLHGGSLDTVSHLQLPSTSCFTGR